MIWDSIYLNAEQMKLLDTAAGRFGVSEKELMRSAGEAIYREVIAAVPDGGIAVVCGPGNNGGDGYAAAAMLADGGRDVTVIAPAPPKGESSRFFAESYSSGGGETLHYADSPMQCADVIADAAVIVDALFGFSFRGQLSGDYAELAELINSSDAFVVSADMPSGVYL